MSETIGFIGLGNMGRPMCLRLLAAGYDVVAFDLADEAVAEVVSAGARPATDAASVAASCNVLLTSLPRPDHVEAVMEGAGALAALRPGSCWVDLTTNRRDLVLRLADAAPDGVAVADSPLTGAVDGARNGRLTLFIGGDDATVARATPILEHLGRVIACGPLGTGNVVKLVTNQLWFVAAAAIGEGFALGMGNGVELSVLWDAITDSVGDSFVARHDAPVDLLRPLRPVIHPRPLQQGPGPYRRTLGHAGDRPPNDRGGDGHLHQGHRPVRAPCRRAARSSPHRGRHRPVIQPRR